MFKETALKTIHSYIIGEYKISCLWYNVESTDVASFSHKWVSDSKKLF